MNKMQICALTPIRPSPKPEVMCKSQSPKLFDAHLVYPDPNPPEVWNDYRNRLMLLAMAYTQNFMYVVWVDDDEMFQEGVTRNTLETDFEEMRRLGAVSCRYKVKEMWTPGKWRCDGIWNQKGRTVLQINPFFFKGIIWENDPEASRFHVWPLQKTPNNVPQLVRDSAILHYGMMTPELRKARVERWKHYDPHNEHQPQDYSYMLSEEGIQLAPAKAME